MNCFKRIAALVLSAALLLTACAKPGEETPPQGRSEEQAKGRYIEEEFALPPEVLLLYDLRLDSDGTLEIFAFIGMDKGYADYISRDGGRTWTQNEPAWLTGLNEKADPMEYAFDNVFFDGEGGAYVAGSGGEGAPKGYHLAADGTVTPIEKLPADENGSGLNGIERAEDGSLLCSTFFSISQTDADFQVKQVFPLDGTVTHGSYTVLGDTLAVCERENIRLYSLADGSLITEFSGGELTAPDQRFTTTASLNMASRILAADPEGGAFYYCDSTGIYHRLLDGSVSERLVDGELSSLTMPTIALLKLIPAADGDFLVMAHNGKSYILLRYHYDADTPTVPSTELTLYSLRDNKTIRQAMGMFQRQNPDVKVTYEVGAPDPAVSAGDALRAFNTRLLAGEGPDVIVLDGMPLDSYMEKGVLEDLSASQAETVKGLLPNIAGAFRREGVYALPARFTVLMAALDSDAAKTVKDLDSLAAWLGGQKNPSLYCTVPDALIRLFYPLLATEWFEEGGTLDRENFAHSLETLKALSAIEGKRNERYAVFAEDGDYDAGDLEFGSVAFSGKMMSAAVGPLQAFNAAAAAEEAIKQREGGALIPLAGEKGAVFTPAVILGVNAAAKQPELARKFVSFALSAQVLQAELAEGLPSNREALIKNAENPYTAEQIEMGQGNYYSMSFIVKDMEGGEDVTEYCELRVLWPDRAYMDDLLDTLENVTLSSPVNETVLQMALEETEDFFDGEKTLEETVDAFAQKYGIYQAE